MRTLYANARVYTPAAREATALLVEDGVVTWLGDDSPAADLVVDLAGALVTPAFVDAHVHATGTGESLTGLDLAAASSLREALDAIERTARARRGRPLLCGGWDETTWPEGRAPTAAELDRASYGGVVYAARIDGHSAIVSSALAVATPGLRALPGYRPDGWLTGPAHDAARITANAALTAADRRALQRAALDAAAAAGIACVHEAAGPAISSAEDLAALLTLAREEPGPDVIGYWGELLGIATAQELGARGAAGDLFCDGSLGSHTAALSRPYTDAADTSGALKHDTADIAEHIVRCTEAGLQAGFHAIGDAAVDQVIAAFEIAGARLGRTGGAGHRVEHVEMVSDPARLAATGVIASMQPAFDAFWGGAQGMYERRLGAERAATMNRFADLAAAGVPLAFGSDSPVTPFDPWGAVRAAAYPSNAGAAISPRSAFAAHTRGGWRAAGLEGDGSGVLAPGSPATFAVWDAGELAVDAPDERVARWSTDPRAAVPGLPDLRPGVPLPTCLMTVRRGTTIFGPG